MSSSSDILYTPSFFSSFSFLYTSGVGAAENKRAIFYDLLSVFLFLSHSFLFSFHYCFCSSYTWSFSASFPNRICFVNFLDIISFVIVHTVLVGFFLCSQLEILARTFCFISSIFVHWYLYLFRSFLLRCCLSGNIHYHLLVYLKPCYLPFFFLYTIYTHLFSMAICPIWRCGRTSKALIGCQY